MHANSHDLALKSAACMGVLDLENVTLHIQCLAIPL